VVLQVKKILIILALIALIFAMIKRKDMTWRQSFLKAVYPVVMKADEIFGKKSATLTNSKSSQPLVAFYSLAATGIDGQRISFEQFKGKKVLLVNTASDCGYTAQLTELENLHKKYGSSLVVLGFPANDFKHQEQAANEEIAAFCKRNFGVTFQLMKKGQVIKGDQQQPVYQWLTDPQKNGWNEQAPEWNFCKYLVDKKGVLTNYFGTAVSPSSKKIKARIGSL
jgi:glutathione peroxidase